MSRSSLGLAMGAALVAASAAHAGEFANAVTQFSQGTVDSKYAVYNTPSAALGRPASHDSFATDISPFNPNWESSEIVSIGVGGSITLSFANPVPVSGGPIIGLFSDAGLLDSSYPNGQPGSPAQTMARAYGAVPAERSAMVEVADASGVFHAVGRLTFVQPSNAWASSTDPYGFTPAATGTPADYFTPFTKSLSDFDGLSYGQTISLLNGSAGGTWVTVPQGLGIQTVSYVRIDSPQWAFDNGTYADTYTSGSTTYNAVLSLDTVAAVPEPASAALIVGGAGLMCLRRRSRK